MLKRFKFWVNVAGRPHRLLELTKTWMMLFEKPAKSHLLLAIFWKFRVEKSEPKKDFDKDKRDYPESVATFPKKTEANSPSGATQLEAKDTKGPLKVRKMDEGITKEDAETKSNS